jgi:hypothetical protein
MHAPDCALTLYATVDPVTLKQPLRCDCEESDGPAPIDEPVFPIDEPRPANVRPLHTGPSVTLTGDAARAYKQLQTAETALRAAQKRKDEALAAFLGAVTG